MVFSFGIKILFNLSLDKQISGADLFRSDWAGNGGGWCCRRKPFCLVGKIGIRVMLLAF